MFAKAPTLAFFFLIRIGRLMVDNGLYSCMLWLAHYWKIHLPWSLTSLLIRNDARKELASTATSLLFDYILVYRKRSLPILRAQYQLSGRCSHGYLCGLYHKCIDPFRGLSDPLRNASRAYHRLFLNILVHQLPMTGSRRRIFFFEASYLLLSPWSLSL